jgi:hypothetical protein
MSYTVKNKKDVVYHLNSQMVKLKNGREQRIYYFTKDERAATAVAKLPAGMEVSERADSGLPVLRKKVTKAPAAKATVAAAPAVTAAPAKAPARAAAKAK